MAGLHFDITGDNSNFLRRLQEVENGVRDTSRQIEQNGSSIEDLFNRMTRAAAAFGAGFTAKELISNIIQVRGEFQQLEVAFKTMLGSEEKANTLMQQLVKTAATTPFDLQGVANGAEQLLAYGENVENVNDDLIRLGNIAAGLSQPLGDIVYLYGTTMTQGRLYTQDLNQFTGRGIPMIRELAKQFGVAENEVKSLVEAGKVGFPEVQKVIMSLTNEGGMFFNLMQEQSKTITGQISNIEDAIATMFNEIGRANEGVINDALSGVSYLIENYEKVGREIMAVVSAYGAYKAVLMSVTAYQGAVTGMTYATEIAELSKLVPAKEKSINADLEAAVASGRLTQERATEVTAIRAQIAALVAKAEIEQKSAIAAVASAQKEFDTAKQRLQVAQDAVDGMDDWIARAEDLGNAELANAYRIQLAEKSIELQSASIQYNTAAKTLNEAKTKEKIATETAETLKTNVNTASTMANAKATDILTIAKTKLASVSKALGLSLLTNPYVLAAAVIAGLTYGIYKLVTAESDTEKAIRETNNALEAQKKHYDDLKNKAGELSNILSNESKSIEERFIAYRQLQRLMPEVFQNMDWETAKRKTNAELTKLETDEMLRQQRIGLKTKVVMSQQKVQGLENSIIRTTNRGGYTGALKEDLAAAKKELEIYTKDLEDFEKADEQAKKESEKPVIFNKKYWEGQKKEAEDALNSIASSQKKLLDAGKFEGIDASVIKSYKDNTKKLKEAEKELKVYDSSSKRESAANKQKKEQQKTAEDLLSLRRQNQQAEIDLMEEGTEKKLKQIDLDYQKELDAIKKQEKELSEKQGGKLTQEQSSEISALYTNAEKKRDKAIEDQYKLEADAMREYLKEYGTFQQQKLAIAEEYAEKIRNAQSEGERLSLEKQRDSAIQQIDFDALNQKIDWQSVFGNFSGILGSQLKETLDGLKAYVNTDKFKNSSEEDKKVVYEAIDRLREVTPGGEGTLNFNKIQQQMDELGNAINRLQTATLNQEIASQNLKKAEDDYANALKTGNEGAIDSARQALDLAKLGANAANDAYKSAEIEVQNFGNNLRDAGADTVDGLNSVASGLKGFADGTLSGAFRGLQNTLTGLSKLNIGGKVGDAIGKLSQTLSSAGVIGQIISAVLSILDVLKDGIGPLISSIIDTVLNAVNGILDNVLSGDMFVQIFSSVKDGIGNILNTITFGGLNSWTDGNAKQVREAIDRLTDRNEILGKSIDRLTEVMDKTAGSKSISAYEQAYKYQKEQIDNTLEIARKQAGYHNAHHSWEYYMGWTDEQLRWARENVDKNFSGTDSLWGLSPEQMKMLLSNADIYEQIRNAGKGGYGEKVIERLEAYADQADKLDELTEKINESLMQVSFDSLRDNFLESLMDMDKDAKSFSEDFSEYMQRALLNFSMGELFDDDLKEWYNGIAKLMKENGGKLTRQQLEDARKEYDAMVQAAMDERDRIAEITGYTSGSSSSSQEASKKGFATASQDSIDELRGRFTALQISNEEIKNQMMAVVVGVNSLVSISTDGNATLSNILDQHVITNSYLEDIVKYTKPILEFGGKFDRMITALNNGL